MPHDTPQGADNSLEGGFTCHFHIYLNTTVTKAPVLSAGKQCSVFLRAYTYYTVPLESKATVRIYTLDPFFYHICRVPTFELFVLGLSQFFPFLVWNEKIHGCSGNLWIKYLWLFIADDLVALLVFKVGLLNSVFLNVYTENENIRINLFCEMKT